jgi:hypothetical protein
LVITFEKLNYEENRFFGFIICRLCPAWLLHYESKTRNVDEENDEITSQYNNILIPFIKKNVDKLKKYLYIKQ